MPNVPLKTVSFGSLGLQVLSEVPAVAQERHGCMGEFGLMHSVLRGISAFLNPEQYAREDSNL